METLAIYLLKVQVVISALYLVYRLCMSGEKFFGINRFILLGILFISFVLPLLPDFPVFHPNNMDGLYSVNPFSGWYDRAGGIEKAATGVQNLPANSGNGHAFFSKISLLSLFLLLNMVVTLILFIRFIVQILRLFRLIRGNKKRLTDGFFCYEHENEMSPFSFFHCLVINRNLYDEEQYTQIILHEKEHIRSWHSIDILLSELAYMFLWINPTVNAFRRSVKLNLEYMADEAVLKKGIDRKSYQWNLLHSLFPSPALVNLFNSSKLKNRIAMMNTKKTSARQLYKYAFILPALFFSYFIVHPVKSRATAFPEPKRIAEQNFSKLQDTTPSMSQLKTYEGYYTFQFEPGKDAYIHIGATENGIVLKQMWDGKEIHFTAKTPLDFLDDGGNFPLKFTKDKNGSVTKVLAFNKDLWNKTNDYKPQIIKTVHLSPDQLKACAGKYKFRFKNEDKDSYIQIRVVENNLVLKQMWDEKDLIFVPQSPLEFSGKDNPGFTLKFIKGSNGTVTQVLALNRDLWDRVKE
ncbi:MAG: M56 family metallopeptidase [Chitinophagales bacterium]